MRKRFAPILMILALTLTAFAALCPVHPEWIAPGTSAPGPGSTITFLVALNQPASGAQAVAISVDNPSLFTSIPSTVYVPNGQSSATFQATLTSTASGGFTVLASANGQAVDCDVYISQPPK